MKTWTIALAASMLAVAVPFVVTAEEPCTRASLVQAIDHPLERGQKYLFIDITEPQKVGEWKERNRAEGLQTVVCYAKGYRADQQLSSILG